MAKTITMYMHTLDGEPATLQVANGSAWLAPTAGHRTARVKLVPSLRQILREQRACLKTDDDLGESADVLAYGYVRVEVPT